MIKELSKKNIIEKGAVYVQVCPGDDIYHIEQMLIDKYNCHYWNYGDYHNCSEHHIGDVEKHNVYFEVVHNKKKNINVIREIVVLGSRHSVSVTSQMILREKKLKRLRRTIKRRNSC